jgi:WD40 repeat protein/serine/threonine protein kinase/Tfp pilus assembly protein PilF
MSGALLAELFEELTNRLQAGAPVDIEAFVRRYPEQEAALRQFLPAIEVLVSMGRTSNRPAAQDDCGDALTAAAPRELGDYRILFEIGRGGMGVVYEAEQISLNRRVALKVLPFAAALDAKQLQRFKNEAQAAAHLHHTNIVQVFAVGCERGVHYYAMQLIEGCTLAQVIMDLRASSFDPRSSKQERNSDDPGAPHTKPEDRRSKFHDTALAATTEHSITSRGYFRMVANLGVQAAEALEHAHQLGVIHRDIKPANLLVDAAGTLFVTDFGLAQMRGGDAGLTMTGDVLGTIRYMSPEQALGKRQLVDHRSDVYSLGVTLYELATLKPAFAGMDRQEVLRQIAFEEPRAPSSFNAAMPGELETIVLKAVSKIPAERYASARELGEDLRRFLEDRPIKARRPTLRERLLKWARRRPALAALLVVSAFAGVVLLAATGLLYAYTIAAGQRTEALNQRKIADEERARARQSELRARQYSYAAHMNLAGRLWNEGLVAPVLDALEEERPPEAESDDLRGFEWRHLWRACHSDRLTFKGHASHVRAVAFSPDGRWIASSSNDGTVKLWDPVQGKEVITFTGRKSAVYSVAFSPDGKWLASGDEGGVARVWDANTSQRASVSKPRLTFAGHGAATNRAIRSVQFSPDGKRVASAGWDKVVRVWDSDTGREILALPGHGDMIMSLAYSPDGKRLASGGHDRMVKIWDAKTGREILTLKGLAYGVESVAFSPDGKLLATGGGYPSPVAELKIWDAVTGRELFSPKAHTSGVTSVAFTPDGQYLASGSEDHTILFWHVQTGREAFALKGHTNAVEGMALSPNGRYLATASWDQTAKIWDLAIDQQGIILRGHTQPVMGVAFSPDGQRLASAGRDDVVKLWDRASGLTTQTLAGHPGGVTAVAFSHDGQLIGSASGSGVVKLWDAITGTKLQDLPGHGQGVTSIAFSPDASQLAWGSHDTTIRIWDLKNRREGFKFKGHTMGVSSVAFSPDGRRLASAAGNFNTADFPGEVKLWNTTTGQEIFTLKGHSAHINCVVFSPDGQRLATASRDRTGKVWDAASGQEIFTLRGHKDYVNHVAFSHDGKRLATASDDFTVKLWDAAIGQETLSLPWSEGPIHQPWGVLDLYGVTSVAFSPDDRCLAAGCMDNTIKIWDTEALHLPERDLSAESELAWHAREAQSSQATLAWSAALFHLSRLFEHESNNWKHLAGRCHVYAEMGQCDKALADYERALQSGAGHEQLRAYLAPLGNRAWNSGPMQEVEAAYRQATAFRETLATRFPNVPGLQAELAMSYLILGDFFRNTQHNTEAEEDYRRAVAMLEQLVAHSYGLPETRKTLLACLFRLSFVSALAADYEQSLQSYRRLLELEPKHILAINNQAWLLATCADAHLRDAQQSVELAKKAVQLAPQAGIYWNTLGAAKYRAGYHREAIAAINRSMELRNGGDSFDWFFLAMASWQVGQEKDARQWRHKAVEWMEKNASKDKELLMFRAEAAALLGIEDKKK